MELLQTPATISKVATMSHRSLRLQVDTNEDLSDEQVAKIMAHHDKFGWFCFLAGDKQISADNVVNLPELPKEDDQISPSERLFKRMYVYYMSKNKDSKGFNTWRVEQLDQIGQRYLEKIDNENI